ncbi:MAG: alpha/beta fold hydrolase [Terracoccus sp.]
MLSRLAPARRRLVTGLLAVLVLAVAAVGISALVRTRSGPAADGAASQVPGPVLVIPGYGGSLTSVAPLAAALRAAGRDVSVVTLEGGAQGDLGDQADTLGEAVDAVLARTGASSVDLVGYSAGGVVARLWVTEDGGSDRVRRLVTLGSPHHGTEVASLGALVPGSCPTACQQLAVDSPLLARLDREPVPPGLLLLSLWSTRDEVVVPPSSSVVGGAASPSLQSICPAATTRHGDLPRDPLVQLLVRDALGTGPLPGLGSVDCAGLTSSTR